MREILGRCRAFEHDDADRVGTHTWWSKIDSTTYTGTKTYTYDSTDQLTTDSTATYTYDLGGNRTMAGYQSGVANRLTNDALTKMVARTIELVLQVRFEPRTGRRRLVSIFEVTGLEGDVVTGNEIWGIDPARDRLAWTGIRPRCLAKIAARGVAYALPPAVETGP